MAKNEYQPQQIRMEMVGPSTIIFKVRDGLTVEAEYSSEKELKVRAWRDDPAYPLLPPMPPQVGNLYKKSFREQVADSVRGHFNPPPKEDKKQNDTLPHIAEDLGNIATLLQGKVAGDKSLQDLLKEESGSSLAERLVDLVEEAGKLFVTPEGRPHVALVVEEHTEVYSLNDNRFETWLRGHFYANERARLHEQAARAHEQMRE